MAQIRAKFTRYRKDASYFLRQNWALIAIWLSNICFATLGLFFEVDGSIMQWISDHWVRSALWGLFATVFLIGTFGQFRNIRQERNKSEHIVRELVTERLTHWAKELGFSTDYRITLYAHDGSAFITVARYSEHPDWRKKGRAVLPDDKGCIGDAWRSATGCCFVNDLPNPNVGSGKEFKEMAKARWKMNHKTTEGIRMKSRTISANVIRNKLNDRRLAVIVFESVLECAFEKEPIDILLERELHTLQSSLESEPWNRFRLSTAADRGF